MTKWDKLVEEVEKIQIDISSPSKYVPRFLELWKQTRAEGNRMQRMNKNLAYEITVHKKKIIELENKTREWDEMVCNICKDLCPKKLEAIWVIIDRPRSNPVPEYDNAHRLDEIREVLGVFGTQEKEQQ